MVGRGPSSTAMVVVPVSTPAVVDDGRFDRHDLGGEPSCRNGFGGTRLRKHRELVELVAGQTPCLGDAVGGLELRRDLVVLSHTAVCVAGPKSGSVLDPIGTWSIDSTPPATATSCTPPATRP